MRATNEARRVERMKTVSFFFLLILVVGVGLFVGEGCGRSIPVAKHTMGMEKAALSDSQSTPLPVAEPVDLETFSAFCDRA